MTGEKRVDNDVGGKGAWMRERQRGYYKGVGARCGAKVKNCALVSECQNVIYKNYDLGISDVFVALGLVFVTDWFEGSGSVSTRRGVDLGAVLIHQKPWSELDFSWFAADV